MNSRAKFGSSQISVLVKNSIILVKQNLLINKYRPLYTNNIYIYGREKRNIIPKPAGKKFIKLTIKV